jgi:hypothetical protein
MLAKDDLIRSLVEQEAATSRGETVHPYSANLRRLIDDVFRARFSLNLN